MMCSSISEKRGVLLVTGTLGHSVQPTRRCLVDDANLTATEQRPYVAFLLVQSTTQCQSGIAMLDFDKLVGRLVALALLSYFSWRVWQSGQKLYENKIGLSVSKQFSQFRLFPSLSICMYMKDITKELLLEDIDGILQRLLDDVLIHLMHKNGTKST